MWRWKSSQIFHERAYLVWVAWVTPFVWADFAPASQSTRGFVDLAVCMSEPGVDKGDLRI